MAALPIWQEAANCHDIALSAAVLDTERRLPMPAGTASGWLGAEHGWLVLVSEAQPRPPKPTGGGSG